MKTPLVLLHGYPFDHTMWNQVIARLNCEVIAPDLRGFGQTPVDDDEPSIDSMANDVLQLLDERGVERAMVGGFSMGGYVGLSFAERYADRLAGFSLINSQALPDTPEARAGRRAMIDKVRREGPQAAVDAAVPKLFARGQQGKKELVRFAIEGAEHAGVAGITWALEAMARRPDRSSVLETLTVPVLLLHSTEDQFIPIERARALAERMPKALCVEIAGVGHCSPLETPELVAKGLSELIARVEPVEHLWRSIRADAQQ